MTAASLVLVGNSRSQIMITGGRIYKRHEEQVKSEKSKLNHAASSLPVVLDLMSFLDTCTKYSRDPPRAQTGVRVPFRSWSTLVSLNEGEQCQELSRRKDHEIVTCFAALETDSSVSCVKQYDFDVAEEAAAVLLSNIGLSRVSKIAEDARVQKDCLFPKERALNQQIWALASTGESTVYYPAGRSPEVMSYFNYSWGNGPFIHDFKLSYPPDWRRFRQQVNLTAKKIAASRIAATSPVVMMVSNCHSKSGRERFFEDFMSYMHVDSYGSCLNNKDLGDLAFAKSNDFGLYNSDEKIKLLSSYKFMLVIENSIDNFYVTEKIFHAWEAGAIPLYLGAPEIERFVPGEDSFIDLRNTTAQSAADYVKYLDQHDEAYLKYHAWRKNVSEDRQTPIGPLGKMHNRSESLDPFCKVCQLVHDQY